MPLEAKSSSRSGPPKAKARRGRAGSAAVVQEKVNAAGGMREEVIALRKDLIVRAAVDAFFDRGYHECTVDMIAEALGGTKAIVYYYFDDKRSILDEIFRRAISEAQEVIKIAIDRGTDPLDKLATFARLYAGWVVDNQKVVAILWREDRSLLPESRQAIALGRRGMDDLLALIIREGVSKGQFQVDDVRTTARAVSGMISYTYSWWRGDHRLTREDIGNYYATAALRIVGAKAPQAGP